jgi:hypothetical protein
MMITCSSKPDIPLHKSLYHPQHPWVGVLHQLNKECMKNNLKTLRHTRKRPLYADGSR